MTMKKYISHKTKFHYSEVMLLDSMNRIYDTDEILRKLREIVVLNLISQGRLPLSMHEEVERNALHRGNRHIVVSETIYLGRTSIYKYNWVEFIKKHEAFSKQPITYHHE
jgi:hypothetical protein